MKIYRNLSEAHFLTLKANLNQIYFQEAEKMKKLMKTFPLSQQQVLMAFYFTEISKVGNNETRKF